MGYFVLIVLAIVAVYVIYVVYQDNVGRIEGNVQDTDQPQDQTCTNSNENCSAGVKMTLENKTKFIRLEYQNLVEQDTEHATSSSLPVITVQLPESLMKKFSRRKVIKWSDVFDVYQYLQMEMNCIIFPEVHLSIHGFTTNENGEQRICMTTTTMSGHDVMICLCFTDKEIKLS